MRSEIEQAAKIALEAQVPEELLVERLAEGAAKGVPPATLQRAMEEEAGTMDAGGCWTTAWGYTLSISGVLGEFLTFVAKDSVMVESSAITGDALSEISIKLGEVAGGQLSLPLRLAVSFSGTDGFAAGIGAGLQFSW